MRSACGLTRESSPFRCSGSGRLVHRPRVQGRRNIGLTLAGGGNRAFFGLGLLHRWGERLRPRLAAIAACSAGAAVAAFWLSGREVQTRSFWRARRAGMTKNIDFTRVLTGGSAVPHGAIYRDTLLCAAAEGGLERIREVEHPVLVVAAAFPKLLPAPLGAAVGLATYNLEKRLRPSMIHPTYGRRVGFEPRLFDLRACESADELADLVIASSSTPPFTPIGRFRGERLLDGGMIDNVPAFATETVGDVRRNLVLLTRPYPRDALPPAGGPGPRMYVAPSRPVPVTTWDYTRPDLVDATIAMGEHESTVHERGLAELLAI